MSLRLVPLGGSLDPVHKDSGSNHQEIQEHLEGGRGGEREREREKDGGREKGRERGRGRQRKRERESGVGML